MRRNRKEDPFPDIFRIQRRSYFHVLSDGDNESWCSFSLQLFIFEREAPQQLKLSLQRGTIT